VEWHDGIEDSSNQSIQLSIQLFFDVESGFLLRRVNVTNTMLGPLNVQWDFSDYREVSGIKLPFLIRTSDVSSYDMVAFRKEIPQGGTPDAVKPERLFRLFTP